jgi:hypothetical protein
MVTVIATGFGREHGSKARDLANTLRGDRSGDPEIPAYVRKNEVEQPTDKVRRPSVNLIEEEEFEVPAFLRRQAD